VEGSTVSLTRREFLVWALIARGLSNDAIARRFGSSQRAVERHIWSLYWKLDLPVDRSVNRRVTAARMFG
jgi:DNA-binding NarL/FixJ family response regulator